MNYIGKILYFLLYDVLYLLRKKYDFIQLLLDDKMNIDFLI